MKWNWSSWILSCVPQVLLLPFIYIGSKDHSEDLNYNFWISAIMVYVLYVSFSKIYEAKNKSELKKGERTVLSGFVSYAFLSLYISISLIKNDAFLSQWYLSIPFVLLQIAQYVMLVKAYMQMKKISEK